MTDIADHTDGAILDGTGYVPLEGVARVVTPKAPKGGKGGRPRKRTAAEVNAEIEGVRSEIETALALVRETITDKANARVALNQAAERHASAVEALAAVERRQRELFAELDRLVG